MSEQGSPHPKVAWKSSAPSEDVELVRSQLGYTPTNFHSIAARCSEIDCGACKENHPAAIRLYPLADHSNAYKRKERSSFEMFPTLYWLTCPILKAKVSELEASGKIKTFGGILERSKENEAKKLRDAHAAYIKERWDLLVKADRAQLENRKGWCERLSTVGIASVTDPMCIKCLHAHLAHYLATKENIIGELTFRELERLKQ